MIACEVSSCTMLATHRVTVRVRRAPETSRCCRMHAYQHLELMPEKTLDIAPLGEPKMSLRNLIMEDLKCNPWSHAREIATRLEEKASSVPPLLLQMVRGGELQRQKDAGRYRYALPDAHPMQWRTGQADDPPDVAGLVSVGSELEERLEAEVARREKAEEARRAAAEEIARLEDELAKSDNRLKEAVSVALQAERRKTEPVLAAASKAAERLLQQEELLRRCSRLLEDELGEHVDADLVPVLLERALGEARTSQEARLAWRHTDNDGVDPDGCALWVLVGDLELGPLAMLGNPNGTWRLKVAGWGPDREDVRVPCTSCEEGLELLRYFLRRRSLVLEVPRFPPPAPF